MPRFEDSITAHTASTDPIIKNVAGVGFFINNGTPEGAVTAPVGSFCSDSSTGKMYAKVSGTGNTGWVIVSPASDVSVTDAGTYYDGTNVEDVLQEIGAELFPTPGGTIEPFALTAAPSASTVGNTSLNFIRSACEVPKTGVDLVGVKCYCGVAGTMDFVWVQVTGGTATVVKTQTETVATGLNSFTLDSTGVDFNAADQTFIGFNQGTGRMNFATTGGNGSFSFSGASGTPNFNANFFFGYWLEYSAPASTGITNVVMLQHALNTTGEADLKGATITIGTGLDLQSGNTIKNGSLNMTYGSTALRFQSPGVTVRDIDITGSGGTIDITTGASSDADIQAQTDLPTHFERGIYIPDGTGAQVARSIIDNVRCMNINGIAFDIKSNVIDSGRGDVILSNCYAEDAIIGYRLDNRCEYQVVSNIKAWNCINGLILEGGNNNVSDAIVSSCRIGFVALQGDNDSHANVTNIIANHCNLYSYYIGEIDNALNITGFQAFNRAIRCYRSKGIHFVNGTVAAEIQTEDVPSALFLGNAIHDTAPGTLFNETGTSSNVAKSENRLITDGSLVT